MKKYLILLAVTTIVACQPSPQKPAEKEMDILETPAPDAALPYLTMSREQLYDKVLGMIVGSAIGDAMGAPTEMWSRNNIQVEYGFVDSLDDMVRDPSPEGTWAMNLPAGGTTDDTRWKVLFSEFLLTQSPALYAEGADPYEFSRFLVGKYEAEMAALKTTETFDPEPLEYQLRRMAWLQEWAIVAKPFSEKDMEGYSYAVNHFYGGEMTCAGMLYSPMVGLAFPGAETKAYEAAYRLGIFDLGYARDITALTAALVSAAMRPDPTLQSVMAVLRDTDPNGYFKSRLVGRASYRLYRDALYIVDEARKIKLEDVDASKIKLPLKGRDPLYMAQMQRAFELLDAKNQDMPFHAGEIHLINLTALLFGEFDFNRSLEFAINFGRDNDTVGAVTGSILGAYYGKNKLPQDIVNTVLTTNKTRMGIDLEQIASQLTDKLLAGGAVSSGN
ncbi:MAG: ADP-ribosylglycohydrolase family protein [Bacteroidia bacterium]|nr:ADP-ribosylglycohydrolase family protein [Bacteroidia bacterium]